VLDSTPHNNGTSSTPSLQNLFQGGLFKGAATVSLSSTDDDRVAADEAAGQVLIPRHWEEQIRTASLGRRRVMRRCGVLTPVTVTLAVLRLLLSMSCSRMLYVLLLL
jgi:hypothetical protein